MPIISNANNDLCQFSFSEDSSLNGTFPEAETAKGIYYQRARLIQRSEDLGKVDHGLLALINVGGNRYTLPWSTLAQFPLTRLGRLQLCTSMEEIAQLCDDYDEAAHEFFFDRSPSAFGAVLNLVAAGRLRLRREMCALWLHDELAYWGIELALMEHCCRCKVYARLEEVAELEQREQEHRHRTEMGRTPIEDTRYRRFMEGLRDMVENPQSGLPGKVFACFSIIMVAVTVISLCISTMPDLREEENQGECSWKCQHVFVVETVCVAWFSLEFLLRFLQASNKLEFLHGPLNVIDALAILPFYVTLVVEDEEMGEGPASRGRGYLDKLGLVLRILRALRILYVMRLARHSLGLRTLGMTMRRSVREFGLLLLFLGVAVALFSPLVHLAESELASGGRDFSSIPASYWWAIISMTTVGYGDMVPHSIPGQLVALSSILSGILIMAFPATSIFHMFSRSYQELKQEQERFFKEQERLFREQHSSGAQSTMGSISDKDKDRDASNFWTPMDPFLTDMDRSFSREDCLLVEDTKGSSQWDLYGC